LQGLDVFGAVEELHNLSAKEMNKLLRDTQHVFTLRIRTGRGAYIRVTADLKYMIVFCQKPLKMPSNYSRTFLETG
jgi:hypothetical protein